MAAKPSRHWNVVAEGAYRNEWRNTRWMFLTLKIPQKVTRIQAECHCYNLYGTTENFETIETIELPKNGIESIVQRVSFEDGIILPVPGNEFQNEVYTPRALCLRDGRIFTREGLSSRYHDEYILPLVKMAAETFARKSNIARGFIPKILKVIFYLFDHGKAECAAEPSNRRRC